MDFDQLFAFFSKKVEILKNCANKKIKKNQLEILEFVIFEFIKTSKMENFKKGVFIENVFQNLAFQMKTSFSEIARNLNNQITNMSNTFKSGNSDFTNSIKKLEENVKRLEIENKQLAKDVKHQNNKVERLEEQIKEFNNHFFLLQPKINQFHFVAKESKFINSKIILLSQIIDNLAIKNDEIMSLKGEIEYCIGGILKLQPILSDFESSSVVRQISL